MREPKQDAVRMVVFGESKAKGNQPCYNSDGDGCTPSKKCASSLWVIIFCIYTRRLIWRKKKENREKIPGMITAI